MAIEKIIGQIFPEKEIDFLSGGNENDRSIALYAYIKMLLFAEQNHGKMEMFGKPVTVDNLNFLLHAQTRRIITTMDELKSVGLVEVADDGTINLPKYTQTLCGNSHNTSVETDGEKVPTSVQAKRKMKVWEIKDRDGEVISRGFTPEELEAERKKNHANPWKSNAVERDEGNSRYTAEQLEQMRENTKVKKSEFEIYFKRMREFGQPIATVENEKEFWDYLVAADFRKATGDIITKRSLPSTFIAWSKWHKQRKEEERKKQEEEKQKVDKEEEDRSKKEKWNDMMLRAEKEINWDEE